MLRYYITERNSAECLAAEAAGISMFQSS